MVNNVPKISSNNFTRWNYCASIDIPSHLLIADEDYYNMEKFIPIGYIEAEKLKVYPKENFYAVMLYSKELQTSFWAHFRKEDMLFEGVNISNKGE